jgi:carboxyl-terminal processing protease
LKGGANCYSIDKFFIIPARMGGLMFHKGKLLVFLGSFIIVLYGMSALFYGKDVAKDDAYKELSVFTDVLKRVEADYVEAPNMNKVQEGAMRGLIDALDPYCSFLSKEAYEAIQKNKANGKAGVGIGLSKRSDVIYIVSCERDGPASDAGMRPGDYVIAVDGQNIEDKSILEANSLLHGAPGSKVKLTVFRSSRTQTLDFNLTRKPPAAIAVISKMLDGNVGFLDISSLEGSSVEQIKVKLKTLISAGAEKILLDLRNCADGESENGADLANFFLRDGLIYYSQNRQGERIQVVEAKPEKHITDLPLVILIDSSTAGPAEIAAGALKDRKRATVAGEKSFGVGSAQKTVQLKSGAVLIFSTAKYFTPGGKAIQDETVRNAGIAPDVLVPDEDMRQNLMVESYYDDQDNASKPNDQDDMLKYRQLQEKIDKIQIDKALELLSGQKALAKKAA